MSRSKHGRRRGLWKQSNRCDCWLCMPVVEKKEKLQRRVGGLDLKQQLTEVPDNVRVFDDFRELPDDIFDSYGD